MEPNADFAGWAALRLVNLSKGWVRAGEGQQAASEER